jgi:hypothetical protein
VAAGGCPSFSNLQLFNERELFPNLPNAVTASCAIRHCFLEVKGGFLVYKNANPTG